MSDTVTVTPYLCCRDANSALAFYTEALGAEETYRIEDGGRIGHAEVKIGGAKIFISDEHPEIGVLSPQAIGSSPVMIVLSVPDVDALFERAVAAGMTVDRPLQDGFDGKLRTAKIIDPYGHRWMIITERE